MGQIVLTMVCSDDQAHVKKVNLSFMFFFHNSSKYIKNCKFVVILVLYNIFALLKFWGQFISTCYNQ
jgi:hypothetical protein